MREKSLRVPDDVEVEGAYRLVLGAVGGEEGCELLVFGRGKRGAFHLRGAHTLLPVRDVRDVPLKKGQWRAIVDYVEAKRLWDTLEESGGSTHAFEAIGPALHPFEIEVGAAPGEGFLAVQKFVLKACAEAARAFNPSARNAGEDP